MSKPRASDREEAAVRLPDEFFKLVDLLRTMSERARAAAAGQTLTHAEIHAANVKGLLGAAGSAAREVWGAEIGALIDGRKPQ